MFPALYNTPPLFLIMLLGVVLLSGALTYLFRRIAFQTGVVDLPTGEHKERKIHTKATPLIGGAAVIIAFMFAIGLVTPWLTGGYLLPKHLMGVSLAAFVLLIGGILDDKYNLKPYVQIWFPVVACLTIIASGLGIEYFTHPLGGVLRLDQWSIQLFEFQGVPYFFTVWSDLFTFCWLMIMIYTTKFLDGLDGLVSSVSVVGLVTLGALSFTLTVWQPETGMLAWIAAAAFAGFLIFNWHPASIFLGESGSTFAGFILGVLAIISGGKVATAVLVLGIPLLDVVWVIFRRLFIERRSPFQADRKHLHLRLLDAGFSQPRAVGLLVAFTTVFGAAALSVQTVGKVRALVALVLAMIVLAGIVLRRYQKHKQESGAEKMGADSVQVTDVDAVQKKKTKRKYGLIIVLMTAALFGAGVWTTVRIAEQPDEIVTLMTDNTDAKPYEYAVLNSLAEQTRGYMWRNVIGSDEGLVFVFPEDVQTSFWMKNVYTPLDIVWVNDRTIVGIEKNVQPEAGNRLEHRLYPSPGSIDWVIEVAAGQADARGFVVGMRIDAAPGSSRPDEVRSSNTGE